MQQLVLFSFVALLGIGHHASGYLSRTSRRRRDARAFRSHLVREIASGHRHPDDELVAHALAWCDEVAQTGRDVPLRAAGHRRPTGRIPGEPLDRTRLA